jgi:Tfp pilus assembly protein FimT
MNAMTVTHGRRPARGFSILELIIVVGITLVIAAIALPGILTATQNFKLRSTVSSISGVVQRARMLAVGRNNYYSVLCAASYSPCTTITGNNTYTFIGSAGDVSGTSNLSTTTEKDNILATETIVFDTGGSHPSDATIYGSLTPIYSLPKFTPRGLPCFGNPCQADPNKMYITFLRQDRPLGTPGWAAINVTPAGRVQVWTWDGGHWR